MGFLSSPDIPTTPPAPNPAQNPIAISGREPSGVNKLRTGSLITTTTQGLKRRANTQRTSLIGGG